jgi:uncharacterized RDD family membrane protein YckC
MTEPTGGTPPLPPQETPQAAPPQATSPQPASWQAPAPGATTIEPGPAPGVAYADLTTRIIAYIIDAILLGIFTFVIFLVLGAIILASLLAGGAVLAVIGFVVLAVFALLASAVYFIYTWMNLRASPGQRLLSLETVNAADGATLTRDQAVRRWAFLFGPSAVGTVAQLALGGTDIAILGSLISLAVLGYSIYLLYTASQSSKRQGFHDVQAATVVVKRLAR